METLGGVKPALPACPSIRPASNPWVGSTSTKRLRVVGAGLLQPQLEVLLNVTFGSNQCAMLASQDQDGDDRRHNAPCAGEHDRGVEQANNRDDRRVSLKPSSLGRAFGTQRRLGTAES